MTKNNQSTRYYSERQEENVADIIEGQRQFNSGAGNFNKGDVINKKASILVECKCLMKDKNSFSIKKEWIEKNTQEAKAMRLDNNCIAFNFGPNSKNYFIIDEKLMAYLIDKLYPLYRD
jgi:hypothetical protein